MFCQRIVVGTSLPPNCICHFLNIEIHNVYGNKKERLTGISRIPISIGSKKLLHTNIECPTNFM